MTIIRGSLVRVQYGTPRFKSHISPMGQCAVVKVLFDSTVKHEELTQTTGTGKHLFCIFYLLKLIRISNFITCSSSTVLRTRLISAHTKFDSSGQDQLFCHTKVPLRSGATRKNKVPRMFYGNRIQPSLVNICLWRSEVLRVRPPLYDPFGEVRIKTMHGNRWKCEKPFI